MNFNFIKINNTLISNNNFTKLNGVDKIYVINLKRRPDRLIKFLNKTPFKNIEIIYGFDGRNHQNERTELKDLYDKFWRLGPGERGCFISHIIIWKKMISNNYKKVLIFEDDVLYSDNFLIKYKKILDEMKYIWSKEDIKILYIGGRFRKDHFTKNCIKISDSVIKNKYIKFGNPYNGCNFDRTTHSYILTKNGADILLKNFYLSLFKKDDYFNLDPVDIYIHHVFRQLKIDIYSSQPLICYSNSKDSDIKH